MSETLSKAALRELAKEWIAQGKMVAGPVQTKPGLVLYEPLASADDLVLEGFIRPANSAKEFVFPRHEVLCRYHAEGSRVELTNGGAEVAPQILLAVRPCDAAALPILDHVFNWDFRDEPYNRRRAATIVVTLACSAQDESWCSAPLSASVPRRNAAATRMLFDLGDKYELRRLTDRGRAVFAGRRQL